MTEAEAREAAQDARYLRGLVTLLLLGFHPAQYDRAFAEVMGVKYHEGIGVALMVNARRVLMSKPLSEPEEATDEPEPAIPD